MSKYFHIILGTLAVGLFLAVWSWLNYAGIVEDIFLPSPSVVLKEAKILFQEYDYAEDISASLMRVMTAFILCTASAVPIGLLMGRVKCVESLLNPFVVFMRYVPISAFIPLLILWVGIGNLQKIIFLWMGTFFYLVALVANAASSVNREFIDTAYTLGATRSQVLQRVIFPAALPSALLHFN